ncbi:hypothetical protein H6768_03250 [Candidatus Peribacteria bacterium]|nr:hypothetical protein [Candidatus Peribacteria bacterium]
MFLGILFFITLTANLWLSWMLGSWVGIGVFLTLVPLSLIVTLSGGIALGLVGMIFGKHDDLSHLKRFMRHFLRGWAWLVCIAWSAPWILFTLLQFSNNIAPATVPKITISNGEKTVVFQSMVHIGSRGFYDEIQNDMTHLRGQEYVFLYE